MKMWKDKRSGMQDEKNILEMISYKIKRFT